MTRILFSLSFFFLSFFLTPVFAQELETVVSTQFDAATIVKGYTLESSDTIMRLGIRPETLNVSTRVDVKTLDPSLMQDTLASFVQDPNNPVSPPVLLGNIYLFDILNKESYDGSDFFFLEIKYPQEQTNDQDLHGRRRIFFFNGVKSVWEELPSEDSPDTKSVRALIHLPYARLAIFEDQIPEIGEASWYGYEGCDCAASPDYPQGTSLLVTSISDPTKSVTVRVNDYGPDRTVFPDRIIDLDKTAFAKLAPLGAGVIQVQVTLLP
ncbi:RlpA-like double-psi beta-barrel domain-containing protein [Candidatus Uhrbacteria bacterium]|nr:RlpA-like double-psi beta-barrel domain-containing protein [Candidatus Uhrbacteria bacterium]